ncbi:MAG: enoyl-CoA hydratase/isomerase family protein [Myxococcota bacterium]
MIDLETRDEAVVLSMRAGENRFDPPFIAALDGALDEVERGDPGRPLVLTGEGKFFSNGLDLAWMTDAGDEGAKSLLRDVLALFGRLLVFPRLTVAALNGHAFAGGGMLALAADFRVMRADRGFFCLPEVDLGMPLHPGMTALITARLPRATAHEAIVTGRRYGGTEAVAAGIVDAAAPEDGVLAGALERAAVGRRKSPETLSALKRGLYETTLEALGVPS